MSMETKVEVARQMRDLVLSFHEAGVLLGDIKCENFVFQSGVLKFVDFDSCDLTEAV
ncbi:hypothetical protein EV174_001524 [Coemansia sp. RSA 2320]|nr:hypothetical protein EV174_001524 [Coemansia sp. RSA 2320]